MRRKADGGQAARLERIGLRYKRAVRPRFKVCCIQDAGEARAAIDAGASAVGLVSRMPSGPGVIDDDAIAAIAAAVPPGVDTFLLTSLTDPDAIAEQQRAAGTSAVQLVDELSPGDRRLLRAALPGVRIVQVVHVEGEESIAAAERAAEGSHAVLLDSGNPAAAIPELGGTGRRHDWVVSARIRERLDVPVYLAGGITPANVGEALAVVRPFAVDVCSGLRDKEFKLDRGKLADFAQAIDWAGQAGEPPSVELRGRSVVLKPLAAADAADLRAIHVTPEVAAWWGEMDDGFPFDEPQTARYTIWVDDRVAGLIQYGEEDEPDYRHAWIDVFVDPKLHGRGVGSDAVETVRDHLIRDRGHHRVTIDPSLDNVAAIHAYEKAGFERVGVMRRAERAPEGHWRDALFMEYVAGLTDRQESP
jgi:phosphoribosylanthranilate isomerase